MHAAPAHTPRIATRAFKIAMTLLLVMGLIPLSLCSPPTKHAFAADQVYLEVNGQIPYAGYSTGRMTVNGAPAICAQPAKLTPASGTYAKQDLMIGYAGSPEWYEAERSHLRALLYFGPGSYGFDPAIWPATWYDGSPMTYDRYLVCLHIMVSDRYSYDFNKATYGCNAEFKRWALNNLTGQLTETETVPDFENTTAGKIYANDWRVPATFNAYALATGASSQVVLTFDNVGWLALDKGSANPALTDGNGCYRLDGASYLVTNGAGAPVATLVTDAAGRAASGELSPGTYYVQETTAPEGYALDPTVHTVEVTPGETAAVGTEGRVVDEPQHDPAAVWLAKLDADSGTPAPQGAASLAGAEFTFDFYPGYYATAQEARASGAPLRTWVFRTDEEGRVLPDEAHWVGGDELYRNADNAPVLPLGTVLIGETKAPRGYLPDPTIHVRQITGGGGAQEVSSYRHPLVSEPIIRGGVRVEKHDKETGSPKPLGGASLSTTFEIANANNRPVVVEGVRYAPGQVVKRLVTEDGEAQTAADCLPFGTYSIREIMPGDGYFLTDGEPRTFSIERNGVIADPFAAKESFKNLVKRGDLDFVKVREGTMERLAGVPFRLVSQTTGEAHVLVTDANGYASTAASWNPHSQRPNANDSAGPNSYDATAGIWFGADVTPDDKRGALPYDTYTLEELPCKANEGLVLVTIPGIVISRDSYTVTLGTIDDGEPDDGTPYLATTAADGFDDDKLAIADAETVITDRVEYANLTIGAEYRLVGTLMSRATGEPVVDDGQAVTAERTFIPAARRGHVSLDYRFNALSAGAGDLVVFERLYDQAGRLVASHEDLDDFGQTVRVVEPSVSSVATATSDGRKSLVADPVASVSDTIAFANLVPGEEYTVRGVLMHRATGKPLASAGAPVTAETSFAPDTGHGSATVVFEFDASELEAGDELVAFETLYRGDAAVATDTDIADENQTVTVERPALSTEASDGLDGDKRVTASRRSTVTDVATYAGLMPGRDYLMRGELHLRDAEGADAGPLRDADGIPVTAELTFTPEAPDGSVALAFDFDSVALAGRDLVIFESLYREEALIASHADIADENQTVSVVPSTLMTRARDSADGDKSVAPAEGVAVADRIVARDVVPGENYSIVGLLVDREDARPLLAADVFANPEAQAPEGLQAYAAALDACVAHGTARVTADRPDLEAQLVYDVDAAELAGRDLAAFAFLFCGDDLIAAEYDPDCLDQVVTVSDREEPPSPPDEEEPEPDREPFPEPRDGKETPLAKTGDGLLVPIVAFVAALACAVMIPAAVKLRRP